MKIVIINKDYLENIPPLISVIYHLSNLGHHVQVITTGYKDSTRLYFEEKGIKAHIIHDERKRSVISKVFSYLKYRQEVKEILPNLVFDCLWVEGANTILALGNLLKRYKYVLHISELYEESPYMLKAIRRVIGKASAVVMPEYNRAVMYQIWFSLRKRPFVLPNIPAFMPSIEELAKLEEKYAPQLSLLKNKNVILYQGHIGAGRDLTNIAKAVQELGDDYLLLLLGKDHNTVWKLKEMCNNIMHVDFIPAPEYLVFTKNSTIGLLSYDPVSINNAYCAPNKLFEYAAYGLPMLGNDIPGLKYMLEYYGAGEIIDENNVFNIKNMIQKMVHNKNSYIQNSKRLFSSYNNEGMVEQIIKTVDDVKNATSN